MEKRIYGIENEYRIVLKNADDDTSISFYHDPTIYSGFIINGARLYVDMGHFPEYATPECTNIFDLIRYENAGNKIIFRKLYNKAHILKSVIGWEQSTSGCHENYLVDSRIAIRRFENLVCPLAAFLVSRQILCGAGHILNGAYQISQRSYCIESIYGTSSTDRRPIIHFRDEPLSGPKYARLHLILGDSNLSDFSTFLKIGTTSLVLEMIEANFLGSVPVLVDPVKALWKISDDPSLRAVVALETKKSLRAIDLQRIYLAKALRFYENNPITPEKQLILKLWQETLDKLSRDPTECDQEIDWLIKKRIIEQYRAKMGIPISDSSIQTLSWLYHDLDPEIGIYQKLLERGQVKTLVAEQEIENATYDSPQDTRAKLRSRVIKAAIWKPILKDKIDINWNRIIYNIPLPDKQRIYGEIALGDPFTSENAEIDEVVELINTCGQKALPKPTN